MFDPHYDRTPTKHIICSDGIIRRNPEYDAPIIPVQLVMNAQLETDPDAIGRAMRARHAEAEILHALEAG